MPQWSEHLRELISQAQWSKGQNCADQQLLPAVVQDLHSAEVLLLAYVSPESLEKTASCGDLVFYSRSRKELWKKGETSGNTLRVHGVGFDCDADTFLFLVEVQGQGLACHRKVRNCFSTDSGADKPGLLAKPTSLYRLVERVKQRAQGSDENSYVKKTLQAGLDHILKKIGEEAGEFIVAAKNAEGGKHREEVAGEAADLVFHMLLVFERLGFHPAEIIDVLNERGGAVRRDGSVPQENS